MIRLLMLHSAFSVPALGVAAAASAVSGFVVATVPGADMSILERYGIAGFAFLIALALVQVIKRMYADLKTSNDTHAKELINVIKCTKDVMNQVGNSIDENTQATRGLTEKVKDCPYRKEGER